MKDRDLAAKQVASSKESGCSIPFSRREFAMVAVMASAVLTDADVFYAVAPLSRFKSDEAELDALKDKLSEFLDVD